MNILLCFNWIQYLIEYIVFWLNSIHYWILCFVLTEFNTLLNILLCFDWTTFHLALQHNGMAPINNLHSLPCEPEWCRRRWWYYRHNHPCAGCVIYVLAVERASAFVQKCWKGRIEINWIKLKNLFSMYRFYLRHGFLGYLERRHVSICRFIENISLAMHRHVAA